MRLVFRSALAALVTVTVITPALADHAVGDRVLARREGQFYPGKVTGSDTGGVTVAFDDGATATVAAADLKAFDWAKDTRVECRYQGDPDRPYYAATLTGVDGDTLHVTYDEIGSEDLTTVSCREPKSWWDEMSSLFKDHARYGKIKKLPKATKVASGDEIAAGLDYWLQGADGGVYIVIKKCVATAKGWTKLSSGDELTARSVPVACGVGVPLPPKPQELQACIVLYGTCREDYQGDGEYAGCSFELSGADPSQIDCKKLK